MAERVVEPLVTQCPHCKTRFRVTHAQLTVAGGRVRCGACLAVFTGTEHLIVANETPAVAREDADTALDALLDELRKDAPLPGESKTPEAVDDVDAAPSEDAVAEYGTDADVDTEAVDDAALACEPATTPDDDFEAASAQRDDVADVESDFVAAGELEHAAKPSVAPVDGSVTVAAAGQPERDGTAAAPARGQAHEEARKETREEAHEVERPRDAVEAPPASRERALRRTLDLDLGIDPDELVALPRRRRRWLIWPVLLLCIAALAAQVLYLQFDVWAKDPQLRPIYAWLCPRIGCKLPEMRALDKLVSKNLVVRADPNVPGALQVDALIINEAPFAQPFPVIELRFSSMGGNLITGRRFRPDEYLAGDLKGAKLMMPMTPVHIALEIDDPGQDAVNYVMVFR